MCDTPFIRRDTKTNESIPVPCGKCPKCIKRRTSGWSFRLVQEDKQSLSSMFLTLTYDTQKVPISKNGFMSLNKRDVQLFFKRLRKAHKHDPRTIKYYAVGEYGGKTSRPHYHIILFNAEIIHVQNAWNNGSVHYGTVSGASIGYSLKYLTKPSKIPLHRNDDRQREFSLMSKGLGANYLTPQMIKWHKQDLDARMYCNTLDGKKIAMPRYYKNKIYTEQERKRIAYFTLQKVIKEELKAIRKDPEHYSKKAAQARNAFKKMHHNSTKGDKL